MRIESAGLTDTGCDRENNKDAFLADSRLGLFLVADGMGGLEAGEVASRVAIESVAARLGEACTGLCPDQLSARPMAQVHSMERKMVLAFEDADASIRRFALQGPGPVGMGTTLTALALCGDLFVLGNVGGSRACLITGQSIRQLSRGHCLNMPHMREVPPTRKQAAPSRQNNATCRVLGMESRLEVDTRIIPAVPGDVFLLCSDGLSDVLCDQDMLALVLQARTDAMQDICARFIALALERRARDNITVVLARCLP